MHIVLCAFAGDLRIAWNAALPEFLPAMERAGHSVAIVRGDITKLSVTAVVSPANSCGYMRGGVDLAYSERFGERLERNLRAQIVLLAQGLLPVGEAVALATGDKIIPHMISAPTMERPGRLAGPEPVLAASRAAVACALREGYDSLAFPGMGTGTGGLSFPVAARAMLQGIYAGLGI